MLYDFQIHLSKSITLTLRRKKNELTNKNIYILIKYFNKLDKKIVLFKSIRNCKRLYKGNFT